MTSLLPSRVLFLVGDILALFLALPITLILRHASLPSTSDLLVHAIPFVLITAVSIIVFFSAGLYDTLTSFSRRELPITIIVAQLITVTLAALLFFFVPVFGIAPKTNLVIYLLVSVALVTAWRLLTLSFKQGSTERAVILGDSDDARELVLECTAHKTFFGEVHHIHHLDEASGAVVTSCETLFPEGEFTLVADMNDPRIASMMPSLMKQFSSRATFTDFTDLYEKIFRRVPLSTLSYHPFIAPPPHRSLYALIKRAFDIVLAGCIYLVLIVATPLLAFLIMLDSRGPIFFKQVRIGRGWRPMSILKFRTMTNVESGVWLKESANKVTRMGAFLRKTSIDELPQVLSVLSGHQSLIGPRSDIEGLADRLREAIPFYELRYTVLPGITGWAQVNQRYAPGNISPQSIEESRIRLAYDLYYVKHWSPFLDFSIALRTIKTVLTRLLPS